MGNAIDTHSRAASRETRSRRSLWRAATAALAAVAVSVGLVACTVDDRQAAGGGTDSDTLEVFATTGYIGDAVRNIAPDADVTIMVGPAAILTPISPPLRTSQRLRVPT